MTERLARAIFKAERGRDAQEGYWTTPATGSFVYCEMAEAVVKTLRATKIVMLNGNNDVVHEVRGAPQDIWDAMLRAVLSSSPKGGSHE